MAERLIGAIEAGGTKFVVALAREDGTLLEQARIETRTPDQCFPDVAHFFRKSSAKHGPIAGFGVASFGPIDIDPASPGYGTFTTTPKPGWAGARFHDVLDAFGAPVVVDTDVNGAALGEWLERCWAGLQYAGLYHGRHRDRHRRGASSQAVDGLFPLRKRPHPAAA